ncbi:hypothetical protein [Streptomyces carpaticus]|uniref:Uncharacterized protein n=1 Tax=Streptomyces carpaticus TaxID=285558 RepID=A0ABV4ZT55_9ACTN
MTARWDIYTDPELERQLAKESGPAWTALRALITELEWRAEHVGRPLGYPWPQEIRRAPVEDEETVFGAIEYVLESRSRRIARILDVRWLPTLP